MFELIGKQSITIRGEVFEVDTFRFDNFVSEQAFTIDSGAEATIYRLIRQEDRALFALKIFRATQKKQRELMNRVLTSYGDIPGLGVLKERYFITQENEPDLVSAIPQLEMAVLMPWIDGKLFVEIITSKTPFTRDESLDYARQVAAALAELEKRGAAHCDVASDNVIIDQGRKGVHVIDADLMYAMSMPDPPGKPQGKRGYQLPNEEGPAWHQWKPEGDRFSGAILICEILCWHDPEIRDMLEKDKDETFFQQNELGNHHDRRAINKYEVMKRTLAETAANVLPLFERAWQAKTLRQCPMLSEWMSALQVDPCVELKTAWDARVIAGDEDGLFHLANQYRQQQCSLSPDQVRLLFEIKNRQQVLYRFRTALMRGQDAEIVAAYQPGCCDSRITAAEKQRLAEARRRLQFGPVLRRAIEQKDLRTIDTLYDQTFYQDTLSEEQHRQVMRLREQKKLIEGFVEAVHTNNFLKAQQIYEANGLDLISTEIPRKERLLYLHWQIDQEMLNSSTGSTSIEQDAQKKGQVFPLTKETLVRKGILRRMMLARKYNRPDLLKRIISTQGLDNEIIEREMLAVQNSQPLFRRKKQTS